jgi:hypothetical protein
MLNNPELEQNAGGSGQFAYGTPVFDANGARVGFAGAYDGQSGYLIVQKGGLFAQDVALPLDVIARNEVNGIYLRLSEAELRNRQWDATPTGSAAGPEALVTSGAVIGASPVDIAASADYIDQQFAEGTPVLDAGGGKVGTISEYNTLGGYIVVQKGLLFPKDLYIPFGAIEGKFEDGIHLKLYQDDIKRQDWGAPPMGDPTSGATLVGAGPVTSAADLGATPTGGGTTSATGLGATPAGPVPGAPGAVTGSSAGIAPGASSVSAPSTSPVPTDIGPGHTGPGVMPAPAGSESAGPIPPAPGTVNEGAGAIPPDTTMGTTAAPAAASAPAQQPIERATVFDMNGDKIGTVTEYDPQAGYFVVQKGWLFPKDRYIPLTAVAGVYTDGVHLNLAQSDLQDRSWDVPPTSGTASGTTGMTAAAPSGPVVSDADLGATPAGGAPVSDADLPPTPTAGPVARDTGMDTTATDVYPVPVEDGTPVSGNEPSINEQAAADAGLRMEEQQDM